ncbi:hypothetical protein SAMN06296273_0526 [Nitrosomonas ureae]|uniref:Uncharacterized protein n=1 Tax=Nitrosomonas ureae TaxID=44577 RepID=A0A285BW66_9PROT|nr:hypothetical protein SAMN06296273_0526 [Nitrosomonas ureae]
MREFRSLLIFLSAAIFSNFDHNSSRRINRGIAIVLLVKSESRLFFIYEHVSLKRQVFLKFSYIFFVIYMLSKYKIIFFSSTLFFFTFVTFFPGTSYPGYIYPLLDRVSF